MKHGKRPTRRQKIMLKSLGLNYENWLIVTDNDQRLAIQHRLSGQVRVKEKEPAM